jgi:hypothetical protein
MNRTAIMIIGGALLLFLFVRMFFVMVGRRDKVEREFVSTLNYDLSARVDSVGTFNEHAPVGFLYVVITRGTIETKEKKLARKLKHGKDLRFLVPSDSGSYSIFSRQIHDYQVGDSLVINTSQDQLQVFRAGKMIHELVISDNLSGND